MLRPEENPSQLEVLKHGTQEAFMGLINPDPSMIADTVPPPILDQDRPKPNSDNGVHEIKPEEMLQVAQSLAEAFEDDPHFSFMLRDEDKKLPRLGHGILSFIEHDWLPNGVIHTNNQLSGAAIWTEPNKWQASIPAQIRILKSLTGVVSLAEIPRLLHVLGFTERMHGKIEREKIGPHYYLAMVGISPEWQRLGWGDALLKPMIDRCDEEGATAYLESATKRSVPLYERNGFEVIAKGSYRGATEPLHFMWRDPQ